MALPLLTPEEAGAQLGLTPGALAQLRYIGGGPASSSLRQRQCGIGSLIWTRGSQKDHIRAHENTALPDSGY